ncbi:MAG: HEAT repeat domain-containing protein [Oligoflexales bacterium]
MSATKALEQYLKQERSAERIKILNDCASNSTLIPTEFVSDLLCLGLSDQEKNALIRSADNSNKVNFEDLITQKLPSWDQNAASSALWEWAYRSDCLLWHRPLLLSRSKELPQRVAYTLLDLTYFSGGLDIVESFEAKNGIEDMSPAFHALTLLRANQWNVDSPKFVAMAIGLVQDVLRGNHKSERSFLSAMAYLMRFKPDALSEFNSTRYYSHIWSEMYQAMHKQPATDKIKSALKKMASNKPTTIAPLWDVFMNFWPNLWQREEVDASVMKAFAELINEGMSEDMTCFWTFFAGISPNVLRDATIAAPTNYAFAILLKTFGKLLNTEIRKEMLPHIRKRLEQEQDPAKFLQQLPLDYVIRINNTESSSLFTKIAAEQELVLSNKASLEKWFKPLNQEQKEAGSSEYNRNLFVRVAYQGEKSPPTPSTQDYWSVLLDAWTDPKEAKLEGLAKIARNEAPIFQLCYIDTLGRFKGIDKGALKLLDFIRSPEQDVIRSVIRSLANIGTTRAKQELVSFLTRPNTSFALQMEIVQLLRHMDLKTLQAELRNAIHDISLRNENVDQHLEVKEALTELLEVEAADIPAAMADEKVEFSNVPELDAKLETMIPDYSKLSSEAKRALRTALFFNVQVSLNKNLTTIDMSPVIDMQYKALELIFRENFEDACGQLLKEGILQRKLDVIGYARPIPEQMDVYERYIESLPIINTIPFFSSFKLRKMLRAICQFRRGKRFTLDGLKAFALFFVCFSRKTCKFGLANQFPLSAMSDDQLLQFCKTLHIFQDFRNRAAHEGFHPDASNDLGKIWKDTAEIISVVHRLKSGVSAAAEPASIVSAPRSEPTIIIKKKAQ